MAFVKAVIGVAPTSVGTGVKVGLRSNRGGKAPLAISISGSAIAAIGFKEGQKINAQIGVDDDHGIIRLVADQGGDAVVEIKAAKKTYQQIMLGHQPQFVNRGEEARWCTWEMLDGPDAGTIEIALPAWADETHPKKIMEMKRAAVVTREVSNPMPSQSTGPRTAPKGSLAVADEANGVRPYRSPAVEAARAKPDRKAQLEALRGFKS